MKNHKMVNGEKIFLTDNEEIELVKSRKTFINNVNANDEITKEQLLAELQTLTAKINALSEPVSLLDKVSSLLGVK